MRQAVVEGVSEVAYPVYPDLRGQSVFITACLAEQCLKTAIQGSDVAQAALFLASRASALMTGQTLIVDGGRALP
jgi:enoyl-[acyl-carrier-protein] reductase (NADH)